MSGIARPRAAGRPGSRALELRRSAAVVGAALSSVVGCASPSAGPWEVPPAAGAEAREPAVVRPVGPPSDEGTRAREWARDPRPLLAADAAAAPSIAHAWALARIGELPCDAGVAAWFDAALAGRTAEAKALDAANLAAATGLLEPPPRGPGLPAEPEGAWAALEDTLWRRYATVGPGREAEADALRFALARVGGSRTVARFGAELARAPGLSEPAWLRARFSGGAEALGVLCARGHSLDGAALAALVAGLAPGDLDAQAAASFGLGRCATASAELLAGPERAVLVERLGALTELAADAAIDGVATRRAAWAWRTLAALAELPPSATEQPIARPLAAGPPVPWTAEVEAVRALLTTAPGRTALVERLAAWTLADVRGARAHVALELLRGLRSHVGGDPQLLAAAAAWGERLEGLPTEPPADAAARGDARAAVLLRCEWRLLHAIASATPDAALARLEACVGDGSLVPRRHADALAVELWLSRPELTDAARADALVPRARDARPTVATAALAALAELEDPRVQGTLRAALDHPDIGIAAAAAAAIAARAVDAARRDLAAVPALERLVATRANTDAIEARLAAIEALGTLARSESAEERERVAGVGAPGGPAAPRAESAPAQAALARLIPALAADPSLAVRRATRLALFGMEPLQQRFDAACSAAPAPGFAAPAPAPAAAGLRITTDVGAFDVAFAEAPAPATQAHLVALARRGLYDGTDIHRVVPNFVAQGGDPRGDGYGGPGVLIPCEWSAAPYRRGAVGMALAGKDTGGSQLFVVHSAQPHLDGRYTLVGYVDAAGMEVVDRILPFTRIEQVAPLDPASP